MHKKLESRTFMVFLVLVSLGFLALLKPFFGTIFWACAISVVFYPLYLRFLKSTKGRRNTSALLTLLICILMVIMPVIFLVSSVIAEGSAVYKKMEAGEINPAQYIEQVRTAFPVVESALARVDIDFTKIKDAAITFSMTAGKWAAQNALSIGQNTFKFLLNICLMLYLTFFLLRDGKALIELIIRALPMGDARERLLFAKFGEVTRATLKGNLVIAVIQGGLGGFIVWALGIPAALLWGVVMSAFSLIPAVGPAIIWVPISIYLFATGAATKAIILIAFGALVIGLVDNILRPILVGRDTKMPDYLVLLSTLGGLGLFGINGFIIGPLVAALFIAFWGIFMREVDILAPDPVEPKPVKKIVPQHEESGPPIVLPQINDDGTP